MDEISVSRQTPNYELFIGNCKDKLNIFLIGKSWHELRIVFSWFVLKYPAVNKFHNTI